MIKACAKCKEEKSLDQFGKGSNITPLHWKEILISNNYCCSYCKIHQDKCGTLT